MLIIGIAGGSGSGKTTVVKAITEQLKENVVVIPQDSYYKDLSHFTEEQKRVHNFDHPDSIDFDLLRAQLKELREGKAVEQPIYSYITCGRSKTETLTVKPADVIIVEGILIFTDPKLRKLMDIKIFVDADDEVTEDYNNVVESLKKINCDFYGFDYYIQTTECAQKKIRNLFVPGVNKRATLCNIFLSGTFYIRSI